MSTTGQGEVRLPITVLDDELIAKTLDPALAVAWMREAVVAAVSGAMSSPARVGVRLGAGQIVFTVGGMTDTWYGYRSYDTFLIGADVDRSDQLVVVQSADSGRVQGVAVGHLLGQLRTGALGGVAVDLLAKPEAATLGMVGSGAQAWSQVWAISAVRELEHVRVHSRTPANAARFARRVERELGITCDASADPREAVTERDVVVLATSSEHPVIEAAWLEPGTHVTTMGPKQVGRAEFGIDLLDWADVVTTDSPAQLRGYEPPALCAIAERSREVVALGSLAVPGRDHVRAAGQNTVYLSVGLAGSEVHLLHRLLAALAGTSDGPTSASRGPATAPMNPPRTLQKGDRDR